MEDSNHAFNASTLAEAETTAWAAAPEAEVMADVNSHDVFEDCLKDSKAAKRQWS